MEILEHLLTAVGCPPDRAKGAIDSARYYFAQEESVDQMIADCILDWYDYAHSPHGKGIEHLGKFIASRVRKLRKPPLAVRQDRLVREFVRRLLLEVPQESPHRVSVVQRSG